MGLKKKKHSKTTACIIILICLMNDYGQGKSRFFQDQLEIGSYLLYDYISELKNALSEILSLTSINLGMIEYSVKERRYFLVEY